MDLVQRLATAFAQHGKRLYLVGGSVRDELLGRPVKDLDFATDARPEEIKAILQSLHPDALYTVGEKFGTIGAVFGDRRLEITTFRAEQYEPYSRKPRVTFGTTLEGDLARRDFTINAIARDVLTGELHDPFGGLEDLRARRIRAVGNPDERFREDPLRLLRAIRLAVELGFDIEPETAAAIRRNAALIQYISVERIAEELNRILLSPQPARGIRLLDDLGLLDHVLPEVAALKTVAPEKRRMKNVFEHTLRVVERTPPDLILRWAALLHDIGKPRTLTVTDGEVSFPGHERVGEEMARQILARLHYDSETIEHVARLVGLHMRANQYSPEWTDGAVRRLIRDADADLERLLQLSRADVTSYRPARVAEAARRVEELAARCRALLEQENIKALKSPLDGYELMALFNRPPGRWIGELKEYLLNQVIEGHLAPDDKERAAELARRYVEEHQILPTPF